MHPKGYKYGEQSISIHKGNAQAVRLTQVDLAEKSGVGLRFVRELEQGKSTLRLDKVNQVLALFGKQVGAVDISKGNR